MERRSPLSAKSPSAIRNNHPPFVRIAVVMFFTIFQTVLGWGQCTNTFATMLPATVQNPGATITTNTGKYFAVNVTAGTVYKITSSLGGSAFNIRMGSAAGAVVWTGISGSCFTAPSTGVAYVHHSTSLCATTTNTTSRTITFVAQTCNTTFASPWSENFDGLGATSTSTANALLPCGWTKTHGDWATSNALTNTYNDPRSGTYYITNAWTATNETVFTRGFSLTAGTTYTFEFYYSGDGFSGWTGDVIYNTQQTVAGSTVLGSSFVTSGTVTTANAYTLVSRTFTPTVSQVYYFGVRVNEASGAPWYLGFDDFSLTALTNCSGTPSSGTASISSASGCSGSSTNLTATGLSSGVGIAYQWQSAPSAGGPWTNITGATTASFTVTPSATTFYRLLTTCSNSGMTNITNTVSYTATGSSCAGVCTISIPSLPVTNQSVACSGSNLLSSANVPACGAASTLYLGGNEALYTLVPTTTGSHTISYSGQTYSSIWVWGGACPNAGGSCVGSISGAGSAQTLTVNLTAGVTYYILFDTWPAPASPCPGTFSITPPPTGCAGTPTGGSSSASTISACSGVNFTVSNTGQTAGIGLTYQWQSSTNNTTWTNVGASSATYTALTTSQTAATYYRLLTTCTNSGISTGSSSILVNMGGACACATYCAATYTNLCSSGDFINLVSTTGGTTNISNTNSGCSGAANNYSHHLSTSLTVQQGNSFTLNLQSGASWGQGFGVWIDYNQNLVFETSEFVYSTVSSTVLNTGSITVPAGAIAGTTRMRVRCLYAGTPLNTDACTALTYGETEDYCVTITAAPACAGTPNPGATTASSSQVFAGGSTTLGITTAQNGTGVSYQWQSGPSSTGPWTSIGGATGSTYVASPTTATYYQCVVTCTSSGASAVSTPIMITTNAYCNPDYTGYTTTPQNGTEGTVDGDMITNVTITLGATTLLNNSSTAALSSPQYTFYSSLPTITMYPSNTYNVNVTAGAFTNQNFAVWIDYNDDNDFYDAGELIGFSSAATTAAYQTISFPINLACTPPFGTHRMRIRDAFATAGSTMDPCATYGWGETEDYLITIVAGTPFAPVFTATPTSPQCPGNQVVYTATAGQTNYSWVYSGTNGTDYNIISGGTSTSNTVTVQWLTSGSKTVTMNYSSPLGCASSGAVTNTITLSNSADWANLQWPASGSINCGSTLAVFGKIYEPGITPNAGADASVSVQVGVSTTNTDPSTWSAAAWSNASFNAQVVNDDEYTASIGSTLAPGTYYYTFRYQIGNNGCYRYGGYNGGFWNGTTNVNGVLTINGSIIDWANVQFPTSGSICSGGSYTVYGQVYEAGVTNNAGATSGLIAEIGVSSANTDPSTWPAGSWSAASFNAQSGNNDEFVATIGSGLAVGTYYYAFRYKLAAACNYQYGAVNGFWNGAANTNGVLTVNAIPTVTAAASPTTVCYGETLTLTGSGATTYTWSNGASNGVAFAPTQSATYTVTGTTAGCSSTASVTVNFNNLTTSTTQGNGDLIWHGRVSSDYATIGNWSQFNGTTLVPATAAPTATTNIIIPVNQTCVATQPNTNANNVNAKNVTIETGASLTMANGSLNVAGNWTQLGTFNAGTGTVEFNGTSMSTVSAPTGSSVAFNNLTMNNTGDVTLSTPITINGSLTLTSGDLIIGTNNLNMANATINGGSWNSYVQTNSTGELRRNLTGTLVYPVGRSTYNPVTLDKAGSAYSFGVRVVDVVTANGQDNGTAVSIANVGRMWHITPAAGYTAAANGTVAVTLSYLNNAPYFANGFVNGTAADRQFMHYGAGWENITNVPGQFTTGVNGQNYTWTTQQGVSDFSPFTVTNSTTSLPIELISFQANCNDNKQVAITWSTASEHNTSHFVVERTRDGVNWSSLAVVAAAGNSTEVLEYELMDVNAQPGLNYYRLTQFDNDGAFETFNVASIVCGEEVEGTQVITYPNPSTESFYIGLDTKEMTGPATISIMDAKGSVVHTESVDIKQGHNTFHIGNMKATPGLYYIQVSNGTITTDIVKHSLR